MNTGRPERAPVQVTIRPGEYYSTTGIEVISTLLGSCVAACLYDPKRTLIGMNHFMISYPSHAQKTPIYLSEAGRYGIHAMELLINDMMAKGTNRSQLRAKIFGGGNLIGSPSNEGKLCSVGDANCRFIREYLHTEGIPIDAEDLGGNFGRVIHFSNGDFAVYRRKVGSSYRQRLALRDQQCLQRAIEKQKRERLHIDLW